MLWADSLTRVQTFHACVYMLTRHNAQTSVQEVFFCLSSYLYALKSVISLFVEMGASASTLGTHTHTHTHTHHAHTHCMLERSVIVSITWMATALSTLARLQADHVHARTPMQLRLATAPTASCLLLVVLHIHFVAVLLLLSIVVVVVDSSGGIDVFVHINFLHIKTKDA